MTAITTVWSQSSYIFLALFLGHRRNGLAISTLVQTVTSAVRKLAVPNEISENCHMKIVNPIMSCIGMLQSRPFHLNSKQSIMLA